MNLVNTKTGEKVNSRIKKLAKHQVKKLKGNKNFQFDWSLEEENEVYAIKKIGTDETLGLISFTEIPEELRIHINLVESVIKHQGKHKEIDGIPGCLIGFVCKMAFKKGYDGFVSLIPKTKLVDYYHQKFGFMQMGRNMVVFLETSQSIINKYLNHE
ncbi:MAG: hypothetical protein AB8F95_18695 [Bacteroidia bacterium]